MLAVILVCGIPHLKRHENTCERWPIPPGRNVPCLSMLHYISHVESGINMNNIKLVILPGGYYLSYLLSAFPGHHCAVVKQFWHSRRIAHFHLHFTFHTNVRVNTKLYTLHILVLLMSGLVANLKIILLPIRSFSSAL